MRAPLLPMRGLAGQDAAGWLDVVKVCAWHVHSMCMACACVWHVRGMCVACAWHVHGMWHVRGSVVVQANTSGVAMGKWDAGCVDFLQKQFKHIVVAKPTTP